jgi:glycosyltransferase involved in cell wall biosynthesis
MKISIVMPTHNRLDALPLTLEALNRQTYPKDNFEVIIVDQASTDGVQNWVLNYSAPYRLRILPQQGKYGISVARNGGVEAASGRLIILLDADIIADPKLVEEHSNLHETNNSPILGCGRLLPYPPCYKSFVIKMANPDAGLDRGTEPEDFPFYYAFGGHLSFTTETFTRVGLFNPELKGFEDTEFAYRASQLGVGIKNCFQAIGYHNHSRSLEERRARGYAYSKMIPRLIELHPELRGTIPGVSELEPLDWKNDSISLKRRKIHAEFWSWDLNRTLLYQFLIQCERRSILPRLAKAAYYRLLLGDMRAGAREFL